MLTPANDQERMSCAVRSLRTYIRDSRELNALLGHRFESSTEELQQSIVAALLDWNTSPPLLSAVTLANHPAKQLLIQCAAIEALTSAGLWHSRERMPSSDGGTTGDDHAKAAEYSAWIERYVANYETKKTRLKVGLNVAAALGNMGLASEYSGLFPLYGEYW